MTLVTGLTPLFATLAAKRASQPFSPNDFARDLDEYYGLRISGKVASDWVTRLETAGLIRNVARPGQAYAVFMYENVPASTSSISESEVNALLTEFRAFATNAFARLRIAVNPTTFDQAFFERIVSPNFLSLIAAKNRLTPANEETVLRLPGRDAEVAQVTNDARLDAVVAAFIYDSLESNQKRWQVIERSLLAPS